MIQKRKGLFFEQLLFLFALEFGLKESSLVPLAFIIQRVRVFVEVNAKVRFTPVACPYRIYNTLIYCVSSPIFSHLLQVILPSGFLILSSSLCGIKKATNELGNA